MHSRILFIIPWAVASTAIAQINDVASLVAAVNNGAPGATVQIAAGTYALTAPLTPKAGMKLIGAGAGQTIITAAASWSPGITGLPDDGVTQSTAVRSAYLINLGDNTHDVEISHLTLTGPNHHGAIFGNNCDRLRLHHLELNNFLWSSIRTFQMDDGRIHDNVFIDAGGRAGITSGITGGAVYVTFVKTSEFWNNRITKTAAHPGNFFGFKGRKGTDCRFHHNTVRVSFSFEFPFENDLNVEIDHNDFSGVISLPKSGGGPVYDSTVGKSFHIHHNWLKSSYALEWARNSAEIDHNFFDFQTSDDGGNLITGFGSTTALGPTRFHNNHVRNPGRGLFTTSFVYNNFSFYNNHVKAATLTRTEGLFGFNSGNDFSTTIVRDNIIECVAGNPRPLVRNSASYAAVIENNTLINITDTASYANPATSAPRGPLTPLHFEVGVQGETVVDGWTTYPNTYAGWKAAIDWGSVPASERDPDDDPDGDGQKNLIEFLGNTSPIHADGGAPLQLQRLPSNELVLTYPERTGGYHSLNIEVWQSSNLTSWSLATDLTPTAHNRATGRTEVRIPPDTIAPKFYQLRITDASINP